jgi:predicted dienelactone hydrolase
MHSLKTVVILAFWFTTHLFGSQDTATSEFKKLPTPTGPYQVGMATFDLIDETRNGLEQRGRLVPIWVYFPMEKGEHHLYPKPLEKRALDEFDVIQVWKKLQIMVHAKQTSDLTSLKGAKHPIVFLNHGDGCLLSDLGIIAEDLASHGYVVIATQHQLSTDRKIPKKFKIRMVDRWSQVIENILFVFEWLKTNNRSSFHNSLDCHRVGLIGYSMGANSLMLLAQRIGYGYEAETLLPHDMKEGVRECIITLDSRRFSFPPQNKYPLLLLIANDRKEKQEQNGERRSMDQLGYKYIYYKGTIAGLMVQRKNVYSSSTVCEKISEHFSKKRSEPE